MNAKRYEWLSCDEHACHCDVVESAEGDMVDYEDYAALEARCAALAAENAGLKQAITTHSQSTHFCEVCGKDDPCSTDDVCYVLNETPATDADIANLRAQGVESAINTVIAMMNHQHPVTSKAIDILRVHAYQLRKGV